MNEDHSTVSAVQVTHLIKRYGDMLALDYFDLDVRQGENCILALLSFDSGTVRVFG